MWSHIQVVVQFRKEWQEKSVLIFPFAHSGLLIPKFQLRQCIWHHFKAELLAVRIELAQPSKSHFQPPPEHFQFEDSVFVEAVHFELTISTTTEESPAGFLFLCPKEHFQTGPSSFCWLDCAAYWSLDPREATELGFPPLQLGTTIWGRSWDASVYAGLRQFHQGNGSDPDSQDVARILGNHFSNCPTNQMLRLPMWMRKIIAQKMMIRTQTAWTSPGEDNVHDESTKTASLTLNDERPVLRPYEILMNFI
ncbi:hypothetical protein B0H14DRAFT_2637210 [Mycena olivaceomarginata]|nr:hypothetical protein B0H14DRAFT_2637210 [Mycena olivaceomarginata]